VTSADGRRLQAVAAVTVLGLALGGCRWMTGAALSQSSLANFSVKASREEGGVVISSIDTFSNIACGIVDLERERRFQPDTVRPIWQARCSDGRDCTVTARYGDPGLEAVLAPKQPLGASAAGECYTCTVGGSRGRGAVRFTVDPKGDVGPCPAAG
jgi:hypothetical protein